MFHQIPSIKMTVCNIENGYYTGILYVKQCEFIPTISSQKEQKYVVSKFVYITI